METLKKVVSNQYFPAGAVLTAVLLFWVVAMLGGLSLLNNNQPPLTTLTWMLFVYAAAVLTPLAGVLAAVDLVRRWRRNRAAAPASSTDAGTANPAADTANSSAGAGEASQPALPENPQPQNSQPAAAKQQRRGRQEAA